SSTTWTTRKPCLALRRREKNFVRPVLNREGLWLRHGYSAVKLNAPRAMREWNTPRGYTRCAISERAVSSQRDQLFTAFEGAGGADLAEHAMPHSFDF